MEIGGANPHRPLVRCTRLIWAITFVLVFFPLVAFAAEQAHTYVTGEGLEIDRCASAWLIKRYVDQSAEFLFLPEEQLMMSTAVQFDTPYAKMQRTHMASTFESVMRRYKVSDEKVKKIGDMIHDIEINFWAGKKSGPAVRFEYELNKQLRAIPERERALQECFHFLDTYQISEK